MDLTPDESLKREPVILDFYEGWIVQAVDGLRSKEKDPVKNMAFIKKMEDGLTSIMTYRGMDAVDEVVKKYNLDKEFGIRINTKG